MTIEGSILKLLGHRFCCKAASNQIKNKSFSKNNSKVRKGLHYTYFIYDGASSRS